MALTPAQRRRREQRSSNEKLTDPYASQAISTEETKVDVSKDPVESEAPKSGKHVVVNDASGNPNLFIQGSDGLLYKEDFDGNWMQVGESVDGTITFWNSNWQTGGGWLGDRRVGMPEGGGGDFDEDGNFVGGGQGGFDADGNPVGGGAGGGVGGDADGEAGGFTPAQNTLLATVKDLLSQFDLDTPGLISFVQNAISKGWDQTQIMLELRKHPDYLANPLFAANIEATKGGARFRSEGELLAYQTEVRRISRQYGFAEPPSSYIALGVLTNKSAPEIEHLLQVQKQTEIYGPDFRAFVEQRMDVNLSDQDLFEIFDKERDTQDFDDAFRAASYQARPIALGLGLRSEAEMRAAEMLGIDPDEWFRRFESVKSNLPQFERLAQVESMVTGNLPADFGAFLAGVDNGLLTKGLVFQDPAALAELQRLVSTEVGRFNIGGGAATSQGGQAIGLLTGAERESYG